MSWDSHWTHGMFGLSSALFRLKCTEYIIQNPRTLAKRSTFAFLITCLPVDYHALLEISTPDVAFGHDTLHLKVDCDVESDKF